MSQPDPEPLVLPAPSFGYTLRAEAPVGHQGPMPRLAVVSSKRLSFSEQLDHEAWFVEKNLELPLFTLPGAPFTYPEGSGDPLPPEIPLTFGGHLVSKAIRSTDAIVAIHGTRSQIIVVRDMLGTRLGAFDLASHGHDSHVQWAEVQDGALYACTFNYLQADESGGRNALVTAIEIGSGKLLWQSEPLICNSYDFLVRDGWIITGYGYLDTDEPAFLFVLDMKTGAAVQRVPLKSGPHAIVEKRGRLYIRTHDRDYVLTVR